MSRKLAMSGTWMNGGEGRSMGGGGRSDMV